MGKRTTQKDAIKDITRNSQVNSFFPYRWSPACQTVNINFYLFLYLYITRITINNGTPHLKSPKNQNLRAALGRPAKNNTGGLQLVCGRPTLALSSALVTQTLRHLVVWFLWKIPSLLVHYLRNIEIRIKSTCTDNCYFVHCDTSYVWHTLRVIFIL